MSSSVLYQRLAELVDAGLVEKDDAGAYVLTPLGDSLRAAIRSLDDWAVAWAEQHPSSP